MKKLMIGLLLALSGCTDYTTQPKTKTVVVERVFQQQPGYYSFLCAEGEKLVPWQPTGIVDVQLFADKNANDPMTVECTYWNNQIGYEQNKLVIHVHSVKDIDATGYTIPRKPPERVQPQVIE